MKQPVPFGNYKLLERISVGGMAEVFRAITASAEHDIQHLVAIKRILPNIAEDEEFIRMFVDEARLAAQLHHANIAQIEQIGQIDGVHYIVLEHIHGRDLKSVFERLRYRNEPMPVAQACIITMKVCEGLDYAHNKHDQSGAELGLVHRDVSPQNVLVSFEGEVKLIDFGIAKATSKGGGTTQAGILKGKLGYISPEQVRGLPVDRRTDVFACGIVLYEMLTGERLFVGNSDFSTLEKVRNVDIDRPTVHNPKLPRELEQIVMRALAVDPADRYQHAIDLHDALQDLVYTTGAFCSRKDLAAWMKGLFTKEYDEECARFAAYYQATQAGAAPAPEAEVPKRPGAQTLVAPAAPPAMAVVPAAPALRAVAPPKDSPARRTFPMGSLAAAKPPPPPGRSQQMSVPAVAPARVAPPAPDEEPTALSVDEPPSSPAKLLLVPPHAEESPVARGASGGEPSGPVGSMHDTREDPVAAAALHGRLPDEDMSSWDDEEEDIETQIYDNDFESAPVPRSEVRASPSQASGGARVRSVAAAANGSREHASRPTSSRPAAEPSRPTSSRPAAEPSRPISRPAAEPSRPVASRAAPEPSRPVASRVAPEPSRPLPDPSRIAPPSRSLPTVDAGALRPGARSPQSVAAPLPRAPERTAVPALDSYDDIPAREPVVPASDRELLPGRGFGASMVGRRPNRSGLVFALGGAALVIGGVALALSMGGRRSNAAAPQVAVDENTGFDLYVDPPGITRWRLDGELRTDRLPSRIRGISPGVHAVVIEAPPGFMSQSQNVTVIAGQAQRVKIELPVMEVTGVFQSDPPGAVITLITDGERKSLGPSPATHKLDPRKQYSVLFEMAGYVSANRPITLSGLERESITVVLERAGLGEEADARPLAVPSTPPPPPPVAVTRPTPKVTPPAPPPPRPKVTPPTRPQPPKVKPTPEPAPDPGAVAEGTLQLSAKPPCQIVIDGKSTGLTTPQREIILSAGRHRITLVNEEYSINESFTVEIRADATEKVIKDFSDRIAQ